MLQKTVISPRQWPGRQSKGLQRAIPDGTFRPNQPVTRQELVTFYWRYANLAGCDMTISQEPAWLNIGMGIP